jgi:hypothetical protein
MKRVPEMKMRDTIPWASVLLWLVPSAISLAAPNAIVAGRSIGRIRLGEPAKQATGPLGAATNADAASGRLWQVWTSPSSPSSTRYELDVLTVRDESGLHEYVEQLRVTSPWFATPQGVHVGSRLSAVIAAFPKVRRVNPDETPAKHQQIALYDDVGQGIAFEFAAATHGVPGSTECRAILVHPKRKSALDEYYPWYMPDDIGVLHDAL